MTDTTAVLPHQTGSLLPGHPTFVNEIVGTLSVHSQYVLHGNLRDEFLVTGEIMPLHRALWSALRPSGFEALITYDQIDGIGVYPPNDPAALQAVERVLGSNVVGRRPSPERLRMHLAKAVGVPEQPPIEAGGSRSAAPVAPVLRPAARVAVVVDHAARLVRAPGQLSEEERDFFLLCQKLASAAKAHTFPSTRQAPLYNPVLWLVDGERDLPAWFTAGVESIRAVAVGLPTLEHRLERARSLMPKFPPSTQDDPVAKTDPVEVFANRTEGMTLQAMRRITLLARDRDLGADRVADAVRIYKLGVDDNPWRRSSVRDQIIKGEQVITERVKGQGQAVAKTLDILKRAALGLSGAQANTSDSRPRGVLFFAGPTGVGKTELAKQVAELLFGDAQAYLRFDMSEFSAEHAADRLTGAPPGYVGFEAGGELTGAVRRQPFQVVLFDEIEKAHPLLLDKFLQILEDGRLTDGQGVTTYFTECVLIFTSNLGIIRTDPKTRERELLVKPGMPYVELEKKVKGAIRDHFTTELGRPELLNRFGDNIVIFDFIDPRTAGGIFGGQLGNVIRKVHAELGVEVELSPAGLQQLQGMCTADPDNGGRGIGNQLESVLINPLARLLFHEDAQPGDRVVITGVQAGDGTAGATLWATVHRGVR
ncbi:AAA family ATPase [Lentzea flaviverrucosa]|uniref:AAA domain (Cdc48 subfamily) n=1 Tax=Lentzea flaviverrucosa TaxID=200379 RepID=A0A1H9CCP5_9PSEU|nr:AAA family ATPase [Lentzea flaviverrucosa]RDI24511.1 Cdc48 subfamily AAA family protein [Lentzea flaviverrucosa]SEP98912.1 AAA domain (Cdc48 subfamily) [Lentzea flaviverrucosa]